MTTKAIVIRTSKIQKISVVDVGHAADEIADGVLKREALFFDNRTPVIKMPLQYQRISYDDAEALIFNLLDEKSQMTVPNRQIKEAIKRLCYVSKLQIDLTEEFWRGQMYVNLTHGIYAILQQELVPMRNELVFDYFINIRYIPHSKLEDAPVFKKYVESSIGMEQYECLMRVLGYCLSSLTKGRKAFVFYGIGRTGKSTILNVLESVIGGGLVSHEPFHTMSNERSKAHYEGKRINISRETSTKVNRHEESFKSLISCEYTTGSEKFEKQRDFISTLSFIFAGNTDLQFSHLDDAILDRLVYIIFNKEIPENQIDLDLEEKLLVEKDVIFSIALDKLKDLINDKYDFKMASIAEEHIRHRRLLIHSAESFIQEETQISEYGKVSKVTLYDSYVDFCKRNALKPDGRNSFYDKVRNFDTSITDGRVPDSSGNSVQGFHGISI
ncbi:MAG: hypothetical protein K2M82_05675 [Lachnospiraceae bacterium]|nr:hypothetical protein [Lachnospiraceae bacterium]